MNFAQLCNQIFSEFPANVSSLIKQTEFRNIFRQNQTLMKKAEKSLKFKLSNSFWNQDLNQIELEISKLMHEIGYFYKPNFIHDMPTFNENFEELIEKKSKINLTMEDYYTELCHYYQQKLCTSWLKLKVLQREKLKCLQIQSTKSYREDKSFYEPIDENKYKSQDQSEKIQNYTYEIKEEEKTSRHEQLEMIDYQIKLLEQTIIECDQLCEKLSNEKIYESQALYDKEHVPQLQINANDELVFDKVNQKMLQNMPFLNADHLREYYNHIHNQKVRARHLTKIK